MICCTRNLLSFLIAVLALTGCMSLAAGTAGIQPTEETIARAATAGSAPATEASMTSTLFATVVATPTATLIASPTHTTLPSTTVPQTATPNATAVATPTRPAPTSTLSPVATPTLEPPAVMVWANANIRSGPGTAYPIIGGARAGDRLSVTGRFSDWWRVAFAGRAVWIWGGLVAPNATGGQAPQVTDFPPPPTVEARVTVAPQSTATPTLTSASPFPDLVALGPDTQYPVRARVIQGWDYEFVDLSAAYDIVVYRDVFGMLAHEIDDENVRRYQRQSRFVRYGPIRITLVDAQPHPNPGCPGWGWVPDRDTFVDPYGMTQDPCRVEHNLFPQGDGAGTTLLIGWGYTAGTTLAIGAAGPHLGDVTTSFLAEALPWPGNLGPADRPDFSQPLYQPLGIAYKEDGRWVWQDAFVEIVPAGQ